MQEMYKIVLLQVVVPSDSFSWQQHTLQNKNDEYFSKNEVFWWLQQFFTHNGTFSTSAYIFWTTLIYFGRPLIWFGRPIDGFGGHFHEIYEILSLNRWFSSKAYIVLATHGQVSPFFSPKKGNAQNTFHYYCFSFCFLPITPYLFLAPQMRVVKQTYSPSLPIICPKFFVETDPWHASTYFWIPFSIIHCYPECETCTTPTPSFPLYVVLGTSTCTRRHAKCEFQHPVILEAKRENTHLDPIKKAPLWSLSHSKATRWLQARQAIKQMVFGAVLSNVYFYSVWSFGCAPYQLFLIMSKNNFV